jgi:hypothetical protein
MLRRRNPGPRLCNADQRFWICVGRRFAGWRIVGDNDPIGVKDASKLNSQDWDLGFLPGPTGRGPYGRLTVIRCRPRFGYEPAERRAAHGRPADGSSIGLL